MPTDIIVTPIGDYYKWTDARDKVWKWNHPVPVSKSWGTFVQAHFDMISTNGLAISQVGSVTPILRPSSDVGVSDDTSASLDKIIDEFVQIADERVFSEFIRVLTESVGVSEVLSNNVHVFLEDSFRSFSGSHNDFIKGIVTSLLATDSDTAEFVIEFLRYPEEFVSIAESDTKSIGLNKNEPINFSPNTSLSLLFYLFEGIGVASTQDREWQAIINVASHLDIYDGFPVFEAIKAIDESCLIEPLTRKAVSKALDDSLAIASDVATIVAFYKYIEASISINEAVAKTTELTLDEKFKILDELLRGGGESVISDLRMLSKALTDAEFEELISQTSPTGYGPFVPFIAGDYEYQEALYKVAMKSRDLSRPNIGQIRYEVDLPDLFDKGEASLTASTTNIQFNKKFNPTDPPSLTVIVKSGSGAGTVPKIEFNIQSDNRSFDVTLKDPVTDVPVPGNIVWKAQGY